MKTTLRSAPPLYCAYAHPLFSCVCHLAHTYFVLNHRPLACRRPTSAQFRLEGASPLGVPLCRRAGMLIFGAVAVLDISGDTQHLRIGAGGHLCASVAVCVWQCLGVSTEGGIAAIALIVKAPWVVRRFGDAGGVRDHGKKSHHC